MSALLGSAALCVATSRALAEERAPDDVAAQESAEHPADTPAIAIANAKTPDVSTEYFVETHDGFRVAYHPAARERVRKVVSALSKIREELSRTLGAPVLADVELRIAALPLELDRLAPQHASTVPAHGGLSFPERNLVIVSVGGAEDAGEDLEASVRHHLAHLAVAEATKGAAVPSWFEEGFAVHFANTDGWARWGELELATLSGDPPSFEELEDSAGHRTSAMAADFVRFASSENVMPALFEGLRQGLPFERALESAFGSDASKIDRAWRRDNTWRYGIFPLALVLVAIAAVVLGIRWLRRRQRVRGANPSRHIHRTRLRLHSRRREMKLRVPIHIADQEVPRVEHDGRWHTLH